MLIKKLEGAGIKTFNNFETFVEYSNDMDDIYKNTEDYNPNTKRKILIVFDDMVVDILSNKKPNPIVTESVIRGRKLSISLVSNTQSYFVVSRNIRVNSAHYFIMAIPNKRDLQQISFNHSSDIDFKDFKNLYKNCAGKTYSFLVFDTTLASDNHLRFRKNVLERI